MSAFSRIRPYSLIEMHIHQIFLVQITDSLRCALNLRQKQTTGSYNDFYLLHLKFAAVSSFHNGDLLISIYQYAADNFRQCRGPLYDYVCELCVGRA
jgi:hypothetical protein